MTTTNEVIQSRPVRLADVQAAFDGAAFDATCREILSTWDNAEPGRHAAVLQWASDLRTQILTSVAEVLDGDDLRTVLCHVYIKVKCEWIVMNNQINYSLLCRGSHQPELMYRAAILAQVLVPIEPLVGRTAIEHIGAFLAQPINQTLQD